jgi:DNA-binding transcriptional ArsR family regulator
LEDLITILISRWSFRRYLKIDSQENRYQDILDYKPVILKVIDDEETLKKLEDPNYDALMYILRRGPMTVREITAAFNKEAKKSSNIDPKSEKTIYHYLKVLEELEIIITAGQRVTIGKTATEKLYMRTARMYERRYKYIDWLGEEGNEWASRFSTLISSMFSTEKRPSAKYIQEFFAKWTKANKAELEKMATLAPDDVVEIITGCDLRDLSEIVGRVYIFGTFLNRPDLLEQLRDCFKE